MSGAATLVPTQAAPRVAEPPQKPGLERRAALAAVLAEGRGAVDAALRTRRSGPRTVAIALWRAEDRAALQPRFVQLGTAAQDNGVRWGRVILLRPESRNPLYRAAKDRLLADTGGEDPAGAVLEELARAFAVRLPCHVVDRRG